MGILGAIAEPLTHKQEIEDLLDEAERIYKEANEKLEKQKIKTTKSLERLGKTKTNAWAGEMNEFVNAFGAFKNVELRKGIETTSLRFIGSDVEPRQMLMNIRSASLTANEIAKIGFATVGTGALVGIASYGGAMMFGAASTGTAIATLTGAAKTNATLAWFGGGAKTAGGLGIAGGKLVLAGITVAPILAVAAYITSKKSKEKLAQANEIHAKAENAAEEMKIIVSGMIGIEKMSNNYEAFIKKMNRQFKPVIRELDAIKKRHAAENVSGIIDFDSLSEVEQKTLHIAWLMAQVYYNVLSVPILNSNGEVSSEAKEAIRATKKEISHLHRETMTLSGTDASAGNIVWKPQANKMLIINTFAVIAFVFLGIRIIQYELIKGVLLIGCALITCPIFIVFRKMAASRKYVWRMIRLIVAVLAAATIIKFL